MKAAAALVFIVAVYALAGTMDYNDRTAAATERAEPPSGRAAPSMERARIWSQRCIKQGKQVFATQADGGKWVIRCVNASAGT